jgi:hypothetical protein
MLCALAQILAAAADVTARMEAQQATSDALHVHSTQLAEENALQAKRIELLGAAEQEFIAAAKAAAARMEVVQADNDVFHAHGTQLAEENARQAERMELLETAVTKCERNTLAAVHTALRRAQIKATTLEEIARIVALLGPIPDGVPILAPSSAPVFGSHAYSPFRALPTHPTPRPTFSARDRKKLPSLQSHVSPCLQTPLQVLQGLQAVGRSQSLQSLQIAGHAGLGGPADGKRALERALEYCKRAREYVKRRLLFNLL